jgi:hypothetical protein
VTYSLPPESFRTLRPEPAARQGRTWDTVLTVVLLVLLPLLAVAATYAGALLTLATDACVSTTCDPGLMNTGFWMAVIAPWAILLLAVVVAVVRLVRRRLAFWVPLAATAAMVVFWFIAAALVGAGVSAS